MLTLSRRLDDASALCGRSERAPGDILRSRDLQTALSSCCIVRQLHTSTGIFTLSTEVFGKTKPACSIQPLPPLPRAHADPHERFGHKGAAFGCRTFR